MSISLMQRIWGLRRPRRLSSVVLRRLRISHLFTYETSGVKLKFFPAIWNINLWEDREMFRNDTELLRRWLRPGDVMVDCGANIGLLTLIGARAVEPGGVVYSIEAHPRTLRYLRENLALNGVKNVEVFHTAVGEKEGQVTFSDGQDDSNHVVRSGSGVTVPMRPLDSIVPAGKPVRLLKIDVEGYEKYVLQGAARVLRQSECVYFESSTIWFARYGYGSKEILDTFRAEGFVLLRAEEGETFRRLPIDYESKEIENLVALRDVDEFARTTGYRIV